MNLVTQLKTINKKTIAYKFFLKTCIKKQTFLI